MRCGRNSFIVSTGFFKAKAYNPVPSGDQVRAAPEIRWTESHMEKRIEGVGVGDPNTCPHTHLDTEDGDEIAVCEDCHAILGTTDMGCSVNDTEECEHMDDVEVPPEFANDTD
jgi:hypothetical protein